MGHADVNRFSVQQEHKLIHEHLKLVRPFAWGIVKRYSLPMSFFDEMVGIGQLALVVAANRQLKIRNGLPFGPYANRCVRGQMLGSLKKIGFNESPLPQDKDFEWQAGQGDDESDSLEEQMERILDRLDGMYQSGHLTKLQAAVLRIRFRDRKSFKEIARELGISAPGVRAHLYHALGKIKLILCGYKFSGGMRRVRSARRATIVNKLRSAIPPKMTMESLSISTGLSPNYLSVILRSMAVPSLPVALILARELHKPVEELFQLDGTKEADDATSND